MSKVLSFPSGRTRMSHPPEDSVAEGGRALAPARKGDQHQRTFRAAEAVDVLPKLPSARQARRERALSDKQEKRRELLLVGAVLAMTIHHQNRFVEPQTKPGAGMSNEFQII